MTAIHARGPQVGIRTVRELRGLTLDSLAERISDEGFGRKPDPDHLSNVERGNKKPSERLMVAWCAALGVSDLECWIPGEKTKAGAA